MEARDWSSNSLRCQKLSTCPHDVMVKALDCRIVASEFVLQLRYYVHFRSNTFGKSMNPTYPSCYGLNSATTVLLEGCLWHLI